MQITDVIPHRSAHDYSNHAIICSNGASHCSAYLRRASKNNRPRRAKYFLQSKGGSQTHPAPQRVSMISPYFYLIFAFALGRSGGAERGFARL